MQNNKVNAKKDGFIKRLLKGSLILSCLGKLSSRLISFLKVSILSFLLTGCAAADTALETGFAGTWVKKSNISGRFTHPAKKAFARSVGSGKIVNAYVKLLNFALYTPLQTYGAFLATLGAYISVVHYIKQYTLDMAIEGNSALISSVLVVAISLPLCCCRKPFIKVLGGSAFMRGVFSDCIQFKYYDGEKRPAAIGTAFMTGSVLGLLLFVCPLWRLMAFIGGALYLLVVFHSTEAGLFSIVFAFPFLSRGGLSAMIIVTAVSYGFKVLRGKRNLHFGASGLFMALLGLCFFFNTLRGGGGNALFALSMCLLYFLAANLLLSHRLLKKCVASAASGFGAVLLVMALQMLEGALTGQGILQSVTGSFSVFEDGTALASYTVMLLPFIFCKSGRGFFTKLLCYLIFFTCIGYYVITGHTALAVLAAATVTSYLAISARRIFRPLILCFGVPVGALYFAAIPITYSGKGVYEVFSGWAEAAQAAYSHLFTGVGMHPSSLALAFDGNSSSMFFSMLLQCGITGLILLVLALVFTNQRLYASLSPVGTPNRNVTAATGAAAIAGLVLGCGTDMWASTEICVIYWLCLGAADAAYRVRTEERRGQDAY